MSSDELISDSTSIDKDFINEMADVYEDQRNLLTLEDELVMRPRSMGPNGTCKIERVFAERGEIPISGYVLILTQPNVDFLLCAPLLDRLNRFPGKKEFMLKRLKCIDTICYVRDSRYDYDVAYKPKGQLWSSTCLVFSTEVLGYRTFEELQTI